MPALVTAVTSLFSAIGFSAGAAAWLGGFVTRIVLSLGLSALSRAMQKKNQRVEQRGLTTETTQTGGTEPQSFVVGRYATGGQLVTPPMTHGTVNGTPNTFLTYVIALSDVPGVALSGLIIDGAYCAIGGAAHPDYGTPVNYKGRTDRIWVRFYDGHQTTADPMLIAKYGSHPQRPWTADMIGIGTAYAILTFQGDREVFKGFPQVRFVLDGIPLYDPRKDPSVGGSGAHSWSNPATWSRSFNPIVMAYNIARGISLPGGDVWGGGWGAADLPLGEWVSAMNACDVAVPVAAGGTEPRYQAGYEIAVDREPADVIDEIQKTCAGRVADIGGVMKVAAGAPGIAVKAITDEDIIITDEQSHSMFPSLAQTYNGVHATFPDPAALWESRDAPPFRDTAAETSDGRRLTATVTLPACPWPRQVQRLMRAWVNEERRFRRHQFVLPPDAAILEPLDVISWTSQRNGYSAKLFEIAEIVHDPVSLMQFVSLREVDPTDYDWNVALEEPWVAPVPGTDLPAPQTVPGFAVSGTALDDAALTARRPALLMTWDGANQTDVTALEYEVRRQGGAQTVQGVTTNVTAGSQIVVAGILPDTDYEARARFVAPRPTVWTGWLPATTPSAYITLDDFEDFSGLFRDAGLTVPSIVSVLPEPAPERFVGELVYLTVDHKIYRWDGSAWSKSVETVDLIGQIGEQLLANGAVGARALAIGDFSNLCENPSFETNQGWTLPAAQGWAYGAVAVRTGQRSLERTWGAGLAASSQVSSNLIVDCAVGDKFYLSSHVAKSVGAACTAAGARITWLDAGRAALSSDAVTLDDAGIGTVFARISGHVTAPAGAAYAVVEPCVVGHTSGVIRWDDIYCNRANVGRLIVDGEIITEHVAVGALNGDRIEAGSIVAGLFAAGAVKAQDMTIDGTLVLSASEAGFQMGKSSSVDFEADGIYMGRAPLAGGGTGYGFLMGSTIAGLSRYIQSGEDTGLNLVNADFFHLAATSYGAATYTTSQTVILGAGTMAATLELQAAGGGGSAYNSGPGNPGGNTTVQLYDGAIFTGQSWSAPGAPGGPVAATGDNTPGASSAYGTGGAPGRTGWWHVGKETDVFKPARAAGNGSGRGAGGGGYGQGSGAHQNGWGGRGGSAGSRTTVFNFDVSGLADPRLVISIGAGGAGVGGGGAGSGGQVKVTKYTSTLVQAGVVPLYPTASGQFTRAANATGGSIFPNLGPGMWIISDATIGLDLEMNVQTHPGGFWLAGWNSRSLTFVTGGRPNVFSSSANAKTYNYLFYRMKL